MVEKGEDYSAFVPRNLSSEEYFPTHFERSLLYEALQLSELSSCSSQFGSVKRNIRINAKGRKIQHDSLNTRDFMHLDALDLASSRFTHQSQGFVKDTFERSKTFRSYSESEASVKGTVFSEDYTTLNKVMEEYVKGTKVQEDNDCDSAVDSGGLSNASTISSDLDRVTLNFSSNASSTEGDSTELRCGDGRSQTSLSDVKKELHTLLTIELGDKIKASLGSDVKTAEDTQLGFCEDKEFDFLKTEQRRRSTSLKTNKTPPGTPSRKKAVRFADALGLDLENVRHIMNSQDPPQIPASAMKDLKVGIVFKLYFSDSKPIAIMY